MAQVNAGRVRFVSRGEYNNSTQYYLFDLVDYNGSSYFAKANTTGNVPTNTTYWQLVAEKGNTGGDGPVGPTGNGIASIVKTASAGLIDTYTITFTNGSTSTFNITNGQDGEVTQEYVDEENERLKSLYNVLPKVSDSGESIELENTGDTMLYKMDLKGNTSQEVVQGEVGLEEEDTSIYVDDVNGDKENYVTLKGNTYQETTTGKNLLNTLKKYNAGQTITQDDITVKFNNDGSLTFNGTATNNVNIYITDTGNLFNLNGTYTLSCSDTDKKIMFFMWSGSSVQGGVNTSTTYTKENVTIDRLSVRAVAGNTFNNVTIYPQLEQGSSATSYEPFTNGASPNPDYPQEIEVVTGNNTIKVEGKNLLENTLTSQTISGVTFTKNSDGTITVNGTANANIYLNLNTEVTLNAGTYILSGCPSGGSSSTYTLYENSVGYNKFDYGSGLDITLTETKTFRVSLAIYSGTSVNNLVFKPMIEKGSQATTYEAYQGASYPVNLGSIELCKIGTYQDRIYKNNGNWYLHKEVGKVVLDGSESWNRNTTATSGEYRFSISITNCKLGLDIPLKSNYFINTTQTTYSNRGIGGRNDVGGVFINDSSLCTLTLEQFETWASTHNILVYYPLATPTDTQITDTTLVNQLEALYQAQIYSTTHINTETSNLLPYINLKYNVVTASPSPDRASEVEVVKGNNTITISNEDGTKTQTYNITLGNLELCKIGNYQDYFYKENGNWYKYKSVEKILLNGTENYDMSSNGNVFYLNNAITNITSIENMKCNYYLYDTFSNLYNGNTDYGISLNTNISKIAIRDKDISYINDFKTWLSNNNTIIYYPLTTPTTTQITDQLLVSQLDELQKAMSYYDKTLISQVNDDKPFIIDAIGIRDLQDIFNLISGE